MKHTARKAVAGLMGGAMLLSLCAGCGRSAKQTADPVDITIWTYYNGNQLESFNAMVQEFNNTVGKEKGITVSVSSQGNVNDLETNVLNAANGKVGSDPMPNIFSAYADTAYTMDKMGLVVDLSEYLTEEEKSAYVDSYLTEGDFSGNGSIKIFPVAKSTELLFLNETDWQAFAQATGASYEDLSTIEGLVRTAESYYNWTDAQTETPNDGKAFFGRDAMANYMLAGARELGCTIFDVGSDGKMTLRFDKDAVRTLWDNYYVPYVKGYFSAAGHFRSDDIKTGNILCYVGSNSSGTFFPKQVMTSDTESHEIAMTVLPCPSFADADPVSVQQGAGMVVTKGDEAEVKASLEFLKWFTAPEHNIVFSVGSAYLPVTKAANNMTAIRNSDVELTPEMDQILTAATDAVNHNELYTTMPFAQGQAARKVLEYALSDLATADRATVKARLEQGQTLTEAAGEFLTDAYFDAWYQETLATLETMEG